MKLNGKSIADRAAWEQAGFIMPDFNIADMRETTRKNPVWIHFGAGNLFRAFPAALMQQLLDKRLVQSGIILAEGYDYEIIEAVNKPHDDLSVLVTLKSDSRIEKTVIASVAESLVLDISHKDFDRAKEVFAEKSLQIASFTITEKGYSLDGVSIRDDFSSGPHKTASYIGKIASLCAHRYINGAHPLALCSMDNCSHNGTLLHNAVTAFARSWVSNGFLDMGFIEYVNNPQKLSFPWSMIDKITPRPDESVGKILEESGFEDSACIVTAKGTYIAPFVNAEETQYLVVEDAFPNGRPPLEHAGVTFTNKETVDKVERMKVCTCLNPLHTALAVFGCLLSYKRISDEMKDPALVALIKRIGYTEGLPVVTDPKIISPKEFIDTVIEKRLPNPFMPDTPARIATDTSQKIPGRFGKTIEAYGDRAGELTGIALVVAAWCRYLMAVDDKGESFTLSPDPMLPKLLTFFEGKTLGNEINLRPILENADIFGKNLYTSPLGEKVEELFKQMNHPGGVYECLCKTLSQST